MEKIKVLLVDDQILFVESLRMVLEKMANDIIVVGVAQNGREAVELASSLQPNVILMDVRMPEMNGVESTRIISERFTEIRVIMLTTFDDDEYIIEALKYGASGYLLKNVPPADLIAAIRVVFEGNVLMAPKVASKLVKKLVNNTEDKPSVDITLNSPDWLDQLSNREKEILSLIAQGYDNREIAKRLYIGEQTVRNYVSIIYCKMGVKDRVLVAKMASKAGLV
ncbi:MAG: response regulator [Bacteroidota bacterium]